MRVIGFHFKKISIEKFKESAEDVQIRTEMDVPKIKEVKQKILKTKDDLLEIDFEYVINYKPEFARVDLQGTILISVDPKTTKNLLKSWKTKEIPEDIRLEIFNVILRKSTLKALELEDELNLPLHISMPSFKKDQEGKPIHKEK